MLYKGTAAAAVPLHSMQFYISKVIIAPEGGGGTYFLHRKRGMLWLYIHAKYCEPGCNTFRFMIFLFFSGAPLVTPLKGGEGVIFFSYRKRGMA